METETVPLAPALARAVRRLTDAGVASPRFDAEELAAFVLGVPRSRLLLVDGLERTQLTRFDDLVADRASRIPLQHLTGLAGFRHLELAVGPGVFVPRPETELLAGWAIERARAVAAPVVVDLCSGSGAITLAVANECPDATVYGVERETMALAWARRNADARAAAGDRPVTLVQGDATAPDVLAELDGGVDVVVTNPPYVPDRSTVSPEVADHDPPAALWGGPDGLDVVRGLLVRAAALLRPGGWLGIEHADVQGESLPALVRRHPAFEDVTDHRDLADRPRFTTARRRKVAAGETDQPRIES
ncbi:peptide chain release factor N(5)-glutamine methyltransferase [Cryptosporangium minutisporangium]|uniref:Release factor glutamine methyltransferase n=1 Tax=Cryptosporangium minutisporangium TaxID=113569 RepID=A0ABP6T0N3_9ACTN